MTVRIWRIILAKMAEEVCRSSNGPIRAMTEEITQTWRPDKSLWIRSSCAVTREYEAPTFETDRWVLRNGCPWFY